MRIVIVAVGDKPPAWVRDACADYAKRLPKPYTPGLVEISTRATARDPQRARQAEGEAVLAALPKQALLVALDERGKPWSSTELSRQLAAWSGGGRDVALAIGGADGHAAAVLERAEQRWSLGPLTLPHMLVRVIVLEQLYRAWTLLHGHPYHRA